MVILSSLRTAGQGVKAAALPLLRSAGVKLTGTSNGTAVRSMGGYRKMIIVPSRYEWNKFKDQWHFYTLLGVIPLGLITTYINIFYGNRDLAEIPEDYEPEHWEYYKHPITRWMAKTFYYPPQIRYEQHLHHVNLQVQKEDRRALEAKVKTLMQARGDYKGWTFMPVKPDKIYMAYHVNKEAVEREGDSAGSD